MGKEGFGVGPTNNSFYCPFLQIKALAQALSSLCPAQKVELCFLFGLTRIRKSSDFIGKSLWNNLCISEGGPGGEAAAPWEEEGNSEKNTTCTVTRVRTN